VKAAGNYFLYWENSVFFFELRPSQLEAFPRSRSFRVFHEITTLHAPFY
jgi:hypothetical protein